MATRLDVTARAGRRSLAALVAATALAACGAGAGAGIPAGPVTIEFATQGLGQEGDATNRVVAAFEVANPSIHVNILSLSAVANVAYTQLLQRFGTGSPVPDVVTLDVIWPAAFAKAGWLAPLDRFQPDRANFNPAQVRAGTYRGQLYAVPWFINAEGVYYRTDLVPAPPDSPQQLVQAALSAMRRDPSVRTGLAFEGDRYEGVVTAFIGFGGALDLHRIDAPENVRALSYMHDAIYGSHVASPATTAWQEPDVEQSYLSGGAAFAVNWPYMFSLAEAPSSPVRTRTAWMPFPAAGGKPQAALGGDVLGINSRSPHQEAAWKFIQYLLRDDVQIQRALVAGDPPGVRSAYSETLFEQDPFYLQEQPVLAVATSRPVDPQYPRISDILQQQLHAALADQVSPQAALTAAQRQIDEVVRSGR
jgi:multiple sugar transport system substrate-binding protein